MYAVRCVFCLALMVPVLLAASCSKGKPLTESEARKILIQHQKNSRNIGSISVQRIDQRSAMGRGIQKLFGQGFAVNDDRQSTHAYALTQKGKELISKLSLDCLGFNPAECYYGFSGAVVKESILSIQEIALDKQGQTAQVSYTVGYEPVEPLYSLVCVDANCEFAGDGRKRTKTRKALLKKTLKGWHIAS